MTALCDSDLWRSHAYIDGAWVAGNRNQTFAVMNPSSQAWLVDVADCDGQDTQFAIEAANRALVGWRAMLPAERSVILRRWYDLIMKHADDLACIMTLEQGKPLAEAKGEVIYGAGFVDWYADEAKRINGDVLPTTHHDKRLMVLKQAIGVVAAITPWNFPSSMITRKCAPALAAGCTVVLKPSDLTPLSALALAELAERAGMPAGVFNVVTTQDAAAVGQVMTASPIVRKLSFTGSTAVGKLLLRDSADTVKKVSMELGGNAPFIVFDDADIDKAVAGVLASKYRNSGQTCVCANRILVQAGIYDTFAEKLAQAVTALKVGDGLAEESQQGPLINEAALQKVEGLVADACEQGARVICGGRQHELGGTFYQPTLLADVTTAMRVAHEEIFGPVAPLFEFDTEADAIAMANDTEYGLAAYFYSQDVARIWRVSEQLEYGMVGINEGIISNPTTPFGGVKSSGLGREGSSYGIDEYLEIKYLCLGGMQ